MRGTPRARKVTYWVAAGVAGLVLPCAYVAYRLMSVPFPESTTYEVVFKWDGGVRSLRILSDRTGREEKNRALRRLIAAETEKTLPSFVRSLGLRRAEGSISCRLFGSGDSYTAQCQDTLGDLVSREAYDPDAKNPLLIAARKDDVSAINQLIGSGAKANFADQHGGTALMRAADLEDPGAVRALLAAGADVNARGSKGGTALMVAAASGRVGAARLLIASGADVNARDSQGRTALLAAAEQGNIKALKLLIAAGADVNAANNAGSTPLMGALTPEIVQALLAAGANVNATAPNGETALMGAAMFGPPSVVKVLLAAHPDVNARSKDGHTALGIAKSMGRRDIAALLRKAGAIE